MPHASEVWVKPIRADLTNSDAVISTQVLFWENWNSRENVNLCFVPRDGSRITFAAEFGDKVAAIQTDEKLSVKILIHWGSPIRVRRLWEQKAKSRSDDTEVLSVPSEMKYMGRARSSPKAKFRFILDDILILKKPQSSISRITSNKQVSHVF